MHAIFPLSAFVAQRFSQRLMARAYVSHSPSDIRSSAKQWETQRVREAYNVGKACRKACNSAINWRSLRVIAYLGNY